MLIVPQLISLMLALSSPVPADIEGEAAEIEAMLVAPCCYTQQVSVHQSSAADEVRRDIRARLVRGETRRQILDAYVARHGKRILAQPPARGFDLTLYVAPLVALVGSVALVGLVVRRFTNRRSMNRAARADDRGGAASDLELERRLDDELRDMD